MASAGSGEPLVEPFPGGSPVRRLEHVAKVLLEKVGPVQRLVLAGDLVEGRLLAAGQVLRVLEQRVAAALDRARLAGGGLLAVSDSLKMNTVA